MHYNFFLKSNPLKVFQLVILVILIFYIAKIQVDIELPKDLPLIEAHEIGESLQIKIEELHEVERAFVHLDHECEHKSKHAVLVKLPKSQP